MQNNYWKVYLFKQRRPEKVKIMFSIRHPHCCHCLCLDVGFEALRKAEKSVLCKFFIISMSSLGWEAEKSPGNKTDEVQSSNLEAECLY